MDDAEFERLQVFFGLQDAKKSFDLPEEDSKLNRNNQTKLPLLREAEEQEQLPIEQIKIR